MVIKRQKAVMMALAAAAMVLVLAIQIDASGGTWWPGRRPQGATGPLSRN